MNEDCGLRVPRKFNMVNGQGVLLHQGVWYGAPLAIDWPLNVVVLLL